MGTVEEQLTWFEGEVIRLEDELSRAKRSRQELWNALAIQQAKHKIGDRIKKGRNPETEFEITRITGSPWRPGVIWVNYYGRRVLKDGKTLHANESQLYLLT